MPKVFQQILGFDAEFCNLSSNSFWSGRRSGQDIKKKRSNSRLIVQERGMIVAKSAEDSSCWNLSKKAKAEYQSS